MKKLIALFAVVFSVSAFAYQDTVRISFHNPVTAPDSYEQAEGILCRQGYREAVDQARKRERSNCGREKELFISAYKCRPERIRTGEKYRVYGTFTVWWQCRRPLK